MTGNDNTPTEDEIRRFQETFIFQLEEDLLLEWARAGDWKLLATYIEGGGAIGPEIRIFLGEVLRGLRRPNNRAPSWTKRIVDRFLFHKVEIAMARGLGKEQAIAEVAVAENVDISTIRRALKKAAQPSP